MTDELYPYVWIRFEDSCPECGKYPLEQLDFLVESLNNFEYDYDELKQELLKNRLLGMPLGIMERIEGKLVVKVVSPKSPRT